MCASPSCAVSVLASQCCGPNLTTLGAPCSCSDRASVSARHIQTLGSSYLPNLPLEDVSTLKGQEGHALAEVTPEQQAMLRGIRTSLSPCCGQSELKRLIFVMDFLPCAVLREAFACHAKHGALLLPDRPVKSNSRQEDRSQAPVLEHAITLREP